MLFSFFGHQLLSSKVKTFTGYSLRWLEAFGFDFKKAIKAFRFVPRYFKSYRVLKLQSTSVDQNCNYLSCSNILLNSPQLSDLSASAGSTKGHYFYQDLYVANLIYNIKPPFHFDIGSRVDGFIAHLLSFEQQVLLGDVRPLDISHPCISFQLIDLTNTCSVPTKNKYKSISCLHSFEHMGLGRYGDPIDILGHFYALQSLVQLLHDEGILYLSHPFGSQSRIEYNAHRIISLSEAKSLFDSVGLLIHDFAYVDDESVLHTGLSYPNIDFFGSYNMLNGCAIWSLRKR